MVIPLNLKLVFVFENVNNNYQGRKTNNNDKSTRCSFAVLTSTVVISAEVSRIVICVDSVKEISLS